MKTSPAARWPGVWARAEACKIDQINIFQATLLAMQRAVAGLAVAPDFVVVDGNHCPLLSIPSQAVAKGDSRVVEINAASIIAKVTRDREMAVLHQQFPEYSFAQHKGYPTVFHLEKLALHGVTVHPSTKLCSSPAGAVAGMNLVLSRGAIVAPTLHIG